MPEPAILTKGLTKTFKPRRRTPWALLKREAKKPPAVALAGIDLEVRKGEFFGLLGPNGAGKTTLVKILSTLLMPTEGEAIVAGQDVREGADIIRRKVGVVLGGDRALYWRLTGRENLWYFSQLYDIPKAEALAAIERVLADVDLTDRADDRVEDYSKGMKQRLHIARGLLTNPDVLLLDEPTIGLDPHAARSLRALARDLVKKHGRTVVLTTHYLYEADELCDRVAIINRGRLVAQGTPAALKAQHAGGEALSLRVRRADPSLRDRLAGLPGIVGVSAASEEHDITAYRLTGPGAVEAPPEAAALVAKAGGALLDVHVEAPSLEDVFVSLTGEDVHAGAS